MLLRLLISRLNHNKQLNKSFDSKKSSVDFKAMNQQKMKNAEFENDIKYVKQQLADLQRCEINSTNEINVLQNRVSKIDTKIKGIENSISTFKLDKQKLFEDMNKSINELIGSKFKLLTKYDNIDSKYLSLIDTLNKKQDKVTEEFDNIKDMYDVSMSNLVKENQSIMRELKRMQIFNREMLSEYSHTLESSREKLKTR